MFYRPDPLTGDLSSAFLYLYTVRPFSTTEISPDLVRYIPAVLLYIINYCSGHIFLVGFEVEVV
jgi:hypothetical protein